MTEKQYKGIAGNFLICDVQKEYAEHLLSILVKRFGMRFQFHFFSNVKKIEQFAEKAEIEILLIAEDCVSEIRGNVKAKKKFILSESMKKEEKQGETTIFRYQSADEILKIIQSGIGEEEAKAAHKPQKKTEEKYDAVQSDFTAPKRKIGIRDEPEESGLIGIYSPIHRIGKTEFALCLGEKISEKVPTLYINMEGYQDYSRQMKELCEKYPAIIQLIDGNNGVTLNDEEYQVFKTYSELSSNREMLERAYYYYFGQADMFHYQKLLKEISETKEREPEQRKKEILECMRQFRLEEAEKEFRFDPKYQKERDEVFQYEQELRSMGLSEEIITVIDNYLCALNAEWLRYGELAYQYGMEDILAMIKE